MNLSILKTKSYRTTKISSYCYLLKCMHKAFHTFLLVITVGITFSLVITVGNTFPPLITMEHVPACYNCREYIPACYNCRNTFPLVITVRNRFLLVITVENTFPLVITVGSFFVADLKCHLWVAKNVAHLKCHLWFTVICMDYDLDFCLKQRKLKEEVVKLRVFLFF